MKRNWTLDENMRMEFQTRLHYYDVMIWWWTLVGW